MIGCHYEARDCEQDGLHASKITKQLEHREHVSLDLNPIKVHLKIDWGVDVVEVLVWPCLRLLHLEYVLLLEHELSVGHVVVQHKDR